MDTGRYSGAGLSIQEAGTGLEGDTLAVKELADGHHFIAVHLQVVKDLGQDLGGNAVAVEDGNSTVESAVYDLVVAVLCQIVIGAVIGSNSLSGKGHLD